MELELEIYENITITTCEGNIKYFEYVNGDGKLDILEDIPR